MRITHLTWRLSRAGGGIPEVVLPLSGAQSRLGAEVSIATLRDGVPAARPATVPVNEAHPVGPIALGLSFDLGRTLVGQDAQLVHLHGLFTWPSRVAATWGHRTGRPVVITPHGMLEPWALSNSAWKKQLFRWFVEDENLRRAACLHALCAQEVGSIRALRLRNPVAVVPNGVDVPAEVPRSRYAFEEAFPEARDRRILLFLGRIHPKKGLVQLVDAWAALARLRPAPTADWLLVVAGPDQLGHSDEVRRRAREVGVDEGVAFTGPLYGPAKAAALAAAEGFVLPSHSEGIPMSVLEAMAYQLPVLVTHGCNVDVEALGAGVLASPTVDSIAEGLRRFLSLSVAERREMGASGRQVVEARYTWPVVAAELLDVYAWLLGGGPRPSCVEEPP